MKPKNEYYIDGILNQRLAVFKEIEEICFPKLEYYVLNNSGSKEDVFDIYQEGFMVLIVKLREGILELNTYLPIYLLGICKLLWNNNRRLKYRSELTIEDNDTFIDDEQILTAFYEHEKRRLFEEKLNDLGEACQKLMKMFLDGVKFDAIAKKLNYSSSGTARTQKHKCQQQLIRKVKSDPRFKELEHGR